MSVAAITRIGLCNLKSFGPEYQEVAFRPLTLLIGRNNSGKSTIMQALLLLKQTLEHSRREVQLRLDGPYVEGLGLRELTHGFPDKNARANWPEIGLEWQTQFISGVRRGQRGALQLRRKGVPCEQLTRVKLRFAEHDERIVAERIHLSGSFRESRDDSKTSWSELPDVIFERRANERPYRVSGSLSSMLALEPPGPLMEGLEHFLPWPLMLPRLEERACATFLQQHYLDPQTTLTDILRTTRYLGATRVNPPSLYKPSTSPLDDVGISGEYAAQLLRQRKEELIAPIRVGDLARLRTQSELEQRVAIPVGWLEAVNQVMEELGVRIRFGIEELHDIGFRLRCGQFSLQHVGRGISSLLPVVVAGLLGLPAKQSHISPHLLFEEVDMHTHPKVQGQLATFFVSLALSGRRIMVETHSDHLVRRLRRMIAESQPGSALEKWLIENVNLVLVDQDESGVTRVTQSSLRPEGDIGETWPADFLDEAPDQERAIHFAGADKVEDVEQRPIEIIHDPDEEGGEE